MNYYGYLFWYRNPHRDTKASGTKKTLGEILDLTEGNFYSKRKLWTSLWIKKDGNGTQAPALVQLSFSSGSQYTCWEYYAYTPILMW